MQVVTRAQVAKALNISPSTVSIWVKKGLIPGVIKHTRRYDLDAILAKLHASHSPAPTPVDETNELHSWMKERGYAV